MPLWMASPQILPGFTQSYTMDFSLSPYSTPLRITFLALVQYADQTEKPDKKNAEAFFTKIELRACMQTFACKHPGSPVSP